MSHMNKILCAVLTAALSLFMGAPAAHAHRPYFSQLQRLVLPDGQVGELRLLKGDGLLGPDPFRVLVLDSNGHLAAISRHSGLIAISCKSASACKIFDLSDDTVLDLEPAAFRSGPAAPGVQDDDRERLWEFESGDDTWGFHARQPNMRERIEGNWAALKMAPIGFASMTVVGALTALAGFTGRRRAEAKPRKIWTQIIVVGVRLLVVSFLLAVSLVFLAFGGLTLELWLGALALGVAATAIASISAHATERTREIDPASA